MKKFETRKPYLVVMVILSIFIILPGCSGGYWYKPIIKSRPTVTSVTPANATPGVAINTKLTATFSEPMNSATIIAPGTFTVTGPFVTPVLGTVTYDGPSRTATFTPSGDLLNDTTYTATISTAAKNPAGTSLASPFAWSFSTAVTPDTTAPLVLFTVPAHGDTGVAINRGIVATFNEAMDPATIIAANVTVTGPSGTIAGEVTYAAGSYAATFKPTTSLAAGATYTVTIKGVTGVKDLAGNLMAANFVWSFTTAAAPDTTAPRISSTNPANLAANVPVGKKINATFTEAMAPATIITANFTLMNGITPVVGTVAYDVLNNIATFSPVSPLEFNTTYTALVTTDATDLAGNALIGGVVPNPWSFTTAAAPIAIPVINLRSAAPFGTFGGSAGMTNQGTLTVINGDIATTATGTSSVTGLHDTAGDIYTETGSNQGFVNGKIYTCTVSTTGPTSGAVNLVSCGIATKGLIDAQTAYIELAGLPGGIDVATLGGGAGELGNRTLAPGVYKSAPGTYAITLGDLTLDAQGDPNAIWVFQMGTSLTVGIAGPTGARSVNLINGAQAKNVFWQVGSAATINGAGGGTMTGTIISSAGVTFGTAGPTPITTLNGRAISLVGSVTMVNTVINVPAP